MVIREVEVEVVDVVGCFASRDGRVRVEFWELGGLDVLVGISFLEGMLK